MIPACRGLRQERYHAVEVSEELYSEFQGGLCYRLRPCLRDVMISACKRPWQGKARHLVVAERQILYAGKA